MLLGAHLCNLDGLGQGDLCHGCGSRGGDGGPSCAMLLAGRMLLHSSCQQLGLCLCLLEQELLLGRCQGQLGEKRQKAQLGG